MEHQMGRIYLDIQRSIASISAESNPILPATNTRIRPKNKSPPRGTQMIRNRPALIRLEASSGNNIPQLECKGISSTTSTATRMLG